MKLDIISVHHNHTQGGHQTESTTQPKEELPESRKWPVGGQLKVITPIEHNVANMIANQNDVIEDLQPATQHSCRLHSSQRSSETLSTRKYKYERKARGAR